MIRGSQTLRGAPRALGALCLVLAVLASREAWAQEEAAGGAAPVAADCSSEKAMVASLTKSVSAHESTIEDLEGKLGKMSMATLAKAEKTESEKEALKGAHAEAKKKMEAAIASLKTEVSALKAELKAEKGKAADGAKTVAKLETEVKSLRDAVAAKDMATEGLVCLPKQVSGAILKVGDECVAAYDKTKPIVLKFYADSKDKVSECYEKAKPLVAKAKDQAHEVVALGMEKAKPAVSKVHAEVQKHLGTAHAMAKPYLDPLTEKVDEVTKPYQPQMKLIRDKALESFALLKLKYAMMAQRAAKFAVSKVSEIEVLAGYIEDEAGAEKAIVNTLVHIPLVTLGYLILSPFLFGGSRSKKLKAKKAAAAKKKKGKAAPRMASPGKPSFKPTGAFRPSPRK